MPEILSAEAISRGLGTRVIGRKVSFYPSVTSTMDIAREESRQGAIEGTVVIANEQTAGRGRLKRAWLAPGGNIALSLILHPEVSGLPSVIMLASLGAARCIQAVTRLKSQIKWPNDVLINGKKVCGILIENDLQGTEVTTIIGIGIDVNLNPADYPEIQSTATSLAAETGREVSRLSVVRSLLVEMDKLYTDLSAGVPLFEEWRDSLVTLGKTVKVTAMDAVFEGVAESVETDGSLFIRRPDGSLTKVVAGDVTLKQ
jgi:BirA family transcriptional regulator, biotin operon repressor / biotin---[acetyl-CoA-carboxylase] ligase